MYYLFLVLLGLCCCVQAFSSCGEWGYSSLRCAGFLLGWLLLWGTGSVVVVHGLRYSVACGIFLEQGSNLCPQHCLAGSYSLYHQESPFISKFKKLKNIIFFSVELLLPNIWQLWIVQWSYHHSGPVFQIRGCMERPIIWWTSALRYISFTLNEFLGQKQCCVEYYDAKEGIFYVCEWWLWQKHSAKARQTHMQYKLNSSENKMLSLPWLDTSYLIKHWFAFGLPSSWAVNPDYDAILFQGLLLSLIWAAGRVFVPITTISLLSQPSLLTPWIVITASMNI